MQQTATPTRRPSWFGLTPLVVFLLVYLVASIVSGDFYKMPIAVAFLVASGYAVAITRGLGLMERIQQFSRGAADTNILMMIWIFILAGAFAGGAKSVGAVTATVDVILSVLPASMLLPGLFIASCFISLSIGTSVGTLVALASIALGIAESLGVSDAYVVAIVASGAFFGDNLSFISDTTIAATRTQGCGMRDKFKVNFSIVFPAALIALGIYLVRGFDLPATPREMTQPAWLMIPYCLVLLAAVGGLNVLLVLIIGIVSSGLLVFALEDVTVWDWTKALGEGIGGMGELITVTLLAGGMLELIRYNGGIDYLLEKLTRHISGKRGAELAIAALVSLANLCTANNTIAILTTGKVAREITDKYQLDPRKSASILDTFSCFIQGIIPYGAQLLLAASLTGLSPIEIIPYLYYTFIMGGMALLAILLRYPRRYS
ncbi:Na+/H+ antiporter NhaC family protein [uncultured Porphyromonas sp.]|uniref:Na+/H+ antiporter NhaC family protein n=1 Tax=uncultured Porphyromonas sp. TaxID=159274 RepID=UPI00261C85D9|nr:Na+/H+ antiporter NhaC family protein [uncultured Porphyromonas sp.]